MLFVSKESHIIIRCEPELRQRLQRLATLERRNLSDLARIVFEDYIATQERAMNLTLRARDAAHAPGIPDDKAHHLAELRKAAKAAPKLKRKQKLA